MGGALPSSNEGKAASIIFPIQAGALRGGKEASAAADPMGINAAKAKSAKALEEAQQQQNAAAASAAEALRVKGLAPKTTDSAAYNPARRFDRLRLGLASTIKRGAGAGAPILSAPSLTGSVKTKLGA